MAHVIFALLMAAAAAGPRFKSEALAVEGDVASVVATDLDGDGKKDLLAVYTTGLPPYQKRFFAIFWNRNNLFAPRPDLVLSVDEAEACAFDVGPTGGRAEELLLITPRGVNAKSFPGRVPAAPRRLVEMATLFHQPIEGQLPRVRVLHDLAGPNSHDLLVPAVGSLSIFRRNGSAYEKSAEVQIDMEVSGGPQRNEGVEVRYGFPALHVIDADGDGVKDIIATQEDRVAIYKQGPNVSFRSTPDYTRDFAVRTAAEHRERGSSVTTLVSDLDGDGVADLFVRKQVFHGVTSAASTSYVFFGRREGGFSQRPAQVLQSEGVTLFQTQLIDLNGDGRPDLVVPYTSFGVFALIRMLTAKTVKVTFQIFPFQPKARRFALDPISERDLKFKVPLAGDSDLAAVHLAADVTGDNKPDLVFGAAEDELDIYPALGNGDFASDPAEVVAVRAAGVLDAVDLDGKGRSDLILYYPQTRGHRSEINVLVNLGGW